MSMSEPGPSTRTRAVTPPRTSPQNANVGSTPERVRQVELNRLRGTIPSPALASKRVFLSHRRFFFFALSDMRACGRVCAIPFVPF
jgi:hypothetical protein